MSVKILFSIIILICSNFCAATEIYYDIDFSSPEHTVGLPPAVGNSITRPSRIVVGSPIVSQSLGALNDQPLVFNTAGNDPSFYYDQIELDVHKHQSYYFVSFDILAQNLTNSLNNFSVIFDTPSIRNIVFQNDGNIHIINKISSSYWEQFPIGTYTENSVLHFEINMDLTMHLWSISKNGMQIYKSSFYPDSDIEHIRFSLGLESGASSNDVSTYAGLDNIIVANGIPEPATLLLFGLGGLFLRKRK